MKKILHRKKWNMAVVEQHMKPPLIPIIKNKRDHKSDNYFVKLKLHRTPTSEKSDLYEFKMDFFDNGDPEEFLLFFITSK